MRAADGQDHRRQSKVARDITEQKRAAERLRQSEANARRLLELNQTTMASMAEGLYTVDSQGLVTYLNPEGERLFGWKSGELLGRRMHDVTHYKHLDGSPFPIEECSGFRVLRDGEVLKNFEDVFIRKDGSFFPVSYSSSPLRGVDGEIVGLTVVFQDVTEPDKRRSLAGRRPPEGRVPGDPRPRAAQSARADSQFLAHPAHGEPERSRHRPALAK